MDFDLKSFFEQPPRMKDEVRRYMHYISLRFVERIALHARHLEIERLMPRHVRMILFSMTPDPQTRYTRQGICTQQLRIKSISKLFQKSMDAAEAAYANKDKYGGIDKRIVKNVLGVFAEHKTGTAMLTNVLVAACISEMNGILLNAACHMMIKMELGKTMTTEILQTHGCTVELSNGDRCTNSSLVRFIHSLARAHPVDVDPVRNDPATKKRDAPPAPASTGKSARRLTNKTVSFDHHKQRNERPHTPDHCFWEDDDV